MYVFPNILLFHDICVYVYMCIICDIIYDRFEMMMYVLHSTVYIQLHPTERPGRFATPMGLAPQGFHMF